LCSPVFALALAARAQPVPPPGYAIQPKSLLETCHEFFRVLHRPAAFRVGFGFFFVTMFSLIANVGQTGRRGARRRTAHDAQRTAHGARCTTHRA
jgi:hypothetical protein